MFRLDICWGMAMAVMVLGMARLILIGSYMEHVTQADPDHKARLMKGLDGFLERDRDRELFDLAPKEPTYG